MYNFKMQNRLSIVSTELFQPLSIKLKAEASIKKFKCVRITFIFYFIGILFHYFIPQSQSIYQECLSESETKNFYIRIISLMSHFLIFEYMHVHVHVDF